MPELGPISRRDLVSRLRALGFEGPYAGGRHEYMTKGHRRIWIPNLHGSAISVDLLARVLRQAGISRAEWLEAE